MAKRAPDRSQSHNERNKPDRHFVLEAAVTSHITQSRIGRAPSKYHTTIEQESARTHQGLKPTELTKQPTLCKRLRLSVHPRREHLLVMAGWCSVNAHSSAGEPGQHTEIQAQVISC